MKYYDLTIPQMSIWETDQFYKNSPITNVSGTGIIKEKIDVELLEKAINVVVKNNDSLRIRITLENNKPKQYFEDYKEFKIKCLELKDENDYNQMIDNLVTTYIDVLKEKTVKFVIFKFPDNTGGFNIVGSHLTADAWGSTKICSEVVKVYTKLKYNEDISDILKSSYIEYINNEKTYIDSDKYIQDKQYWEAKFSDVTDEIAYILPKCKNTSLKTRAIRKEIKIDKSLTNMINEYCKTNKISPFVFFLGVYSIYLSKINGIDEIIISTPMLNRRGIKEKEIIGMFVNSLPFRIKMRENVTDLFSEISQDSMQMLRHQKYSYMELLKNIRKKRNINYDLYDVVLSYQNAKTTANESKIKYSAKWHFNKNISESINIHISDIDQEENYIVYYDFKEDRLSEMDILNIHSIILEIINQIITKNCKKIDDIEILTNNEVKLLKKFNDTGDIKQDNKTIVEIFEEMASKYPLNIAIKYKDEEITYKKLMEKINNLASILRKKGITNNEPVAMMLDKSIDMIISMFAILKAGGCYVPILPEEQKDRVNYILNDCKPLLVITHKKYDDLIHYNKIYNLDKENNTINDDIKNINNINDVAYIIYTSGTTGTPKGVKVTHKNVCNLKLSIENDEIIKPTNKDVSISLLKYSFDAFGIDIYSSLLFGGKLILMEKEKELHSKEVLETIEKEKVTRSFLIPKWLENICIEDSNGNANLSSLKVIGSGGETLKPQLVKELYEKYPNLKIINLYGPTETTMFTSYKILKKKDILNNNISIGKPIYGSRIAILNKKNQFLPTNMQGELCIYEDNTSINNIAQGYINKEEETKEKFVEIYNPIINKKVKIYKTGDIAQINKKLELEFFGREDDIVKVNGGYLVSLNEIEKNIYHLLNEKYQVSAYAVPLNNTKAIVVFVSPIKENLKIDNIEKLINKGLTFYMRPKKIIELEKIPINNSGKVDKKVLQEMAIELLSNKENIIIPKTTTETIIYNIIKKYTDIKLISITDDFMQDLGIDSLAIATIYTELEAFGIELQDIYTYTNIKDLAYYIDVGEKKKEEDITNNIVIKNNTKKFDITNVLLTGATGFLGAHILYELLKCELVKKVYCTIRKKEFKTAQDRFYETINYYFKDNIEIKEILDKKLELIECDITQKKLGLKKQVYNKLCKNITTVINSAANVRHYGKEENINNINVDSVKVLLNFCENNNISMAHISTLSIAGFKTQKSENKIFDENELYIGQRLNNNPYLLSKYRAEEIILSNSKVNTKIFRIGNIMPRLVDGKFQKNYTQNAFMNAMKIMFDLKKVPYEYCELSMELSPVDRCAKAILTLIEAKTKDKVFHIANNKLIKIKDLIKLTRKCNYKIENIEVSSFIKKLNQYSGIGKYYIKEYILKNKVNDYKLDKTTNLLNNLNFQWNDIDEKYMKNILKIIQEKRWENE